MKFIISRTSEYFSEKKPCDEAFKKSVEHWQTRTCSEAEFNRKFSNREGLWREKGKNHQITKEGYITRQEDDKEVWVVEIETLGDLLKLSNKYGRLVIEDYWDNDIDKCIEIYDDYRE